MSVGRQNEGYVILRSQRQLLAEYEHSKEAMTNRQYLSRLREVIAFVDPILYRGIARDPLRPLGSDEDALNQNTPVGEIGEVKARRVFQQIIGENRALWDYDPSKRDICKEMLDELGQAQKIYHHLEAPQHYEIVHLARGESQADGLFLGYDVGQWAGEHFSIICDSVIRPKWHPPTLEGLAEIGERLQMLNQFALFVTLDEAIEFREFYLSRHWAETEVFPGEFCIIQVSVQT